MCDIFRQALEVSEHSLRSGSRRLTLEGIAVNVKAMEPLTARRTGSGEGRGGGNPALVPPTGPRPGVGVSRKDVILEWKGLSVKAGDRTILKPLGTSGEDRREIRLGDLLFLQGSSGSGKSTFIKLCLGILPWNLQIEGDLTYYHHFRQELQDQHLRKKTARTVPLIQAGKASGSDGAAAEQARAAHIHWHRFHRLAGLFFGYCPQNPFARFEAHRTLRHQLAESAVLGYWSRAPELAAIGYAGMPSFHTFVLMLLRFFERRGARAAIDRELVAREYGHQLKNAYLEEYDLDALPGQRSYGFNQRVGMVQLPPSLAVLFLDEPFNGVDLVTRRLLIDYYCELLAVGRVQAIVCATHDRGLIERFRAVMHDRGLKGPWLLELGTTPVVDQAGSEVAASELTKVKAVEPSLERSHVYRRSEDRHLHVVVPRISNELGSFLGITGPSNCGKTSLGRHLCGWEEGAQITRREIFVPQNPFASFSPALPVAESFDSLGAIKAVARLTGRQDEIMPLLYRPPSALSGGQLQRLQILGAVASGPNLLFLDEPFAHQDDEWAKNLEELLEVVLQRGHVGRIMLVSHDIRRLLSSCRQLLLLGEFYLRAYKGETLVLTFPVLHGAINQAPEESLASLKHGIERLLASEELLRRYDSGEGPALTKEEKQDTLRYIHVSLGAKLEVNLEHASRRQKLGGRYRDALVRSRAIGRACVYLKELGEQLQ